MESLLIYVEGPGTAADPALCERLVEGLLKQEHDWTVAPPRFVNEPDEAVNAAAKGGDGELWTVGLVSGVPTDVVQAAEEEIREDLLLLVDALPDAARVHLGEFVIEFREEAVGFHDGGEGDARFLTAVGRRMRAPGMRVADLRLVRAQRVQLVGRRPERRRPSRVPEARSRGA